MIDEQNTLIKHKAIAHSITININMENRTEETEGLYTQGNRE